jgi:hypothetical protein
MSKLVPYDFQLENARVLAEKRAWWLLDEPGLGKSVSLILTAQRLKARRVLIVAPGSVRRPWLDRFIEWAPEYSVACIEQGPRAADSEPEKFRQIMYRRADVQIVSHELLPTVEQTGWDVLCLDEGHEVVSYRSKIAGDLRSLFAANPDAARYMLSATPMSAQPIHTWTLLNLFWPGKWGKATRQGDPPYAFRELFANKIVGYEERIAYKGVNVANRSRFAQIIGSHSSRTLRSDLGDLLPPVDFRAWDVPASDKRQPPALVVDKVDVLIKESAHVAIFTHHQAAAQAIYEAFKAVRRYDDVPLLYLDGNVSARQRAAALAAQAECGTGLLVGTIDALGTGIDLTFVRQYIIAEPIRTAHKIVQLDGRFRRLSAVGVDPAIGFMLFREDKDDDTRTEIVQRMEDYLALVRASAGDETLRSALKVVDSEDSLLAMMRGLGASYRGSNVELDEEDDEHEGDETDGD